MRHENYPISCVLSIFFILFLQALLGGCFATEEKEKTIAIAPNNIQFEAQMINSPDLCKIENPRFNREIGFPQIGSYKALPCNEIKKEYSNIQIVRINIKNNSNEIFTVNLQKDFTSIYLIQKSGKKLNPIAFQSWSNIMNHISIFYFTKDQNDINVIIKPKEQDDLIFLFESATVGDYVKFDNIDKVKLQ
jgi:hypothetical protein